MKTISQRELRNSSGEIMRGLARGESYRITNNGDPVGLLIPAGTTPLEAATLREGSQVMEFPPAHVSDMTSEELLDELRGDR